MIDEQSLFETFKTLNSSQLGSSLKHYASQGKLDIVRYLLISPELETHADIHAEDDAALHYACYEGQLDVVKYLLTSPELKEHSSFKPYYFRGFIWACESNKFEVADYLMNSPDLKERPDQKSISDAFICCFANSKLEMIRYMIFDLNIEKSTPIKLHLWEQKNSKLYEQVENMFKIRDFNNNLQESLVNNDVKTKRNKI